MGKATALDILCNADPFIEINIIAKVEIEKKSPCEGTKSIKLFGPHYSIYPGLCIDRLLFAKMRKAFILHIIQSIRLTLESYDTFWS